MHIHFWNQGPKFIRMIHDTKTTSQCETICLPAGLEDVILAGAGRHTNVTLEFLDIVFVQKLYYCGFLPFLDKDWARIMMKYSLPYIKLERQNDGKYIYTGDSC